MDREQIEALLSDVLDAAEKLETLVGDVTALAERIKAELPD